MLLLIRPALVLFIAMTLICGVVYPSLLTVVGSALFSKQVEGSLVYRDGKAVGSLLIGQAFHSPHYFWGRPSATTPQAYNAAASAGSNLGPNHPDRISHAQKRLAELHIPPAGPPIPVDLVTASASGLDPDISLAAAILQIPRIAAARQQPEALIAELVLAQRLERRWGFWGEPRVNVLALNLALDQRYP